LRINSALALCALVLLAMQNMAATFLSVTPIDKPTLPMSPEKLAFGNVTLRFVKVVPGEPSRGLVYYYHFRIHTSDQSDVGHINFRVGDTNHVRLYAGHIGFEILEQFRGRGYARDACRAIAPLVRSIYREVIITCDTDNDASRKTIERLGARFLEEIAVPANDPHYRQGRRKLRYQWTP
jgi:predicted acetyltransferase